MVLHDSRIQRLADWIEADGLAEPELSLLGIEHALQTAELARQECREDDELIIAALLHDVGHAEGGHEHGHWAQVHLAGWFSERTLWLMAHHITAKRYICTVEPAYHDHLSADSQSSLRLQGGVMAAGAARDFSRHPWFADVMRLREWDDNAKRGGWLPRPFDEYRSLLIEGMERAATG